MPTMISIPVVYALIFFSGASLLYFLRVVTHPLRGYPGPRLAALSGWYMAYFEVVKKGALLRQVTHLHAKYNSMFFALCVRGVRFLPAAY